MLDLDPIRERVNAATKGPWKAEHHRHGKTGNHLVSEVHPPVTCEGDGTGGIDLAEDAELIAHAPTDLADLIAEVESLREEVTEAEAGYAAAEEYADVMMNLWLVDFGDDWDYDDIESAVVAAPNREEAFRLALDESDYDRWPPGRYGSQMPTLARSTVHHLGALKAEVGTPGVIHVAVHYG